MDYKERGFIPYPQSHAGNPWQEWDKAPRVPWNIPGSAGDPRVWKISPLVPEKIISKVPKKRDFTSPKLPPLGLPRVSLGSPLGFLWDSFGSPLGFLWVSLGFRFQEQGVDGNSHLGQAQQWHKGGIWGGIWGFHPVLRPPSRARPQPWPLCGDRRGGHDPQGP